ncbi:MAG TPA: Rid family hydrolase [Xanthomonadaceae bacterium]|jgi:enamine deaminase RidA (YjgF/YER057c/UK114 family)|nr:Rid family hydrolase [Xanthomonadaceae bacterium]
MSPIRVLLSIAMLASATATPIALADQPSKTIVIPAGWDGAYDKYHYAPAVRVGDMVIVSGIPADRGATYEEKIRNLFEDLKNTLQAAGAQMDDVVEITTFHSTVKNTPEFEAEFKRFSSVYVNYFPNGYPAWTAVGTTALLDSDAPVEMRVMAIVGSGKRQHVSRASKAKP